MSSTSSSGDAAAMRALRALLANRRANINNTTTGDENDLISELAAIVLGASASEDGTSVRAPPGDLVDAGQPGDTNNGTGGTGGEDTDTSTSPGAGDNHDVTQLGAQLGVPLGDDHDVVQLSVLASAAEETEAGRTAAIAATQSLFLSTHSASPRAQPEPLHADLPSAAAPAPQRAAAAVPFAQEEPHPVDPDGPAHRSAVLGPRPAFANSSPPAAPSAASQPEAAPPVSPYGDLAAPSPARALAPPMAIAPARATTAAEHAPQAQPALATPASAAAATAALASEAPAAELALATRRLATAQQLAPHAPPDRLNKVMRKIMQGPAHHAGRALDVVAQYGGPLFSGSTADPSESEPEPSDESQPESSNVFLDGDDSADGGARAPEHAHVLYSAPEPGIAYATYDSTDVLSRISSHPELCAELCQKMQETIISELTEGMKLYQHGQPSDIKATSAVAYSWMVDKLEMAEFEPRDRLTLLAFLSLVVSKPFRVSKDMREAGEITMREAFEGTTYGSAECDRAKFWPKPPELLPEINSIKATSKHGQHIRFIHAVTHVDKNGEPQGLRIARSLTSLPIHLFWGEGTTPANIERVLSEMIKNFAHGSDSFDTALSSSGFSKEKSIEQPLDASVTLLLPSALEGTNTCDIDYDPKHQVEWSECQPKLEFVKISKTSDHQEVAVSLTYEASIGSNESSAKESNPPLLDGYMRASVVWT